MEIWDDLESTYINRTATSKERYDEIQSHVPAGVASTYRAWDPHPFVVDRAEGVHLHDVDDNSYLDFDMNNGAGMVGHTHPAVTEAIKSQLDNGTLFTHPHNLLAEAAKELKKRWDPVDLVRFTNSGTESTMHAIRTARAYTGKDKLLKIEGSYHGVHDAVLISKSTPKGKLGHPERPAKVIESDGVPEAIADTVEIAPWNDLDAIEEIMRNHVNEIGALIVEPIVMNVGVTQPYKEFLQGLRELCDEYGIVYIFDEVKTGVKVAPGGATEYYDVEPDLVAMAKSIGGNYPVGAFGGREEVMRTIENGAAHFGTYNGNPLVLRAVTTVLRDVLTDDAYQHVNDLGEKLAAGYEEIMTDAGITGHVKNVNSQGIVHFTDERVNNYREYLEHIDEEFHENYWFAMLNQGVLPHPHHASQQWTISVQHEEEHIDEHLEAFKNIAPRLAEQQ
ncbi:aspartate aminotransferase family protein [Natronorubrum aibiense]|uniref:Glutamate-1-semialdehyde 2,1-aminomutase n=1 Tax=Natronorubrum aibiense TaxID=348826 RepID=A0A5P9P8U0_9EURY|nr:aspartate aminotransferase family protein [Natronorubrum aibiense]QFU84532.1 aminotransferase class III-fold pyridoxal phosphate-dependent enzyme [Natronorubrum aibiense]